MKIKEVAGLLNVSENTIRRELSKGSFGEVKKDNGEYEFENYHVLKLIADNSKYLDAKAKIVDILYKELEINPSDAKANLSFDVLEAEILKRVIENFGDEVVEAFSGFLDRQENQQFPYMVRSVENKLNITKQPTTSAIVNILRDVVSVDAHNSLEVGQELNADQIEQVFGRKPQQEGINFCKDTKELYVITKLGIDNPTVEKAEYNDFWKNGKIYYEGKGQSSIQEFKGSNLHLYRKYQAFHNLIKCRDLVPNYIHVFNRVKIYEADKFQYLGKFHVTDYLIDEHSVGRLQDTKTAIVYELTPIVDRESTLIDENYIF